MLRFALLTTLLILGASFDARCRAGDSSGAEPLVQIERAIEQLGSPDFRSRELAAKELIQRGSTAIEPMERALPGSKGETRYRLRSILDFQRRSPDLHTRRAAEAAMHRIARGPDRPSASWARSQMSLPGFPRATPVVLETSSPEKS